MVSNKVNKSSSRLINYPWGGIISHRSRIVVVFISKVLSYDSSIEDAVLVGWCRTLV